MLRALNEYKNVTPLFPQEKAMNGFITRSTIGLILCAGMSTLVGCNCYRDLVDPCWPERYDSMARHSVRDMAFVQTEKGHILDQTIWNWMFEVDPKTGFVTDRLNGAGIEQLKYISRHLPAPDGQLFLQTAQDISYVNGIAPDRLVAQRTDLNERRIASIQRFLATQSVLHPASYTVAIHDFAPPGLPANPIAGTKVPPTPIQGAYQKLEDNFQGKMPNAVGFGGGPAPISQ
jgi:hypothetical protein